MVSVLSNAGNCVRDTGRMPSTDASNLAETTMGLARQAGYSPTSDHTLSSATASDSNNINHFILGEDRVHRHLLLEETVTEVHLLVNGATVYLDLHEVRLLLLEVLALPHLGVADGPHYTAVLANAGQVLLNLPLGLGVLEGILGECLLLGFKPVLVEATLDLVRQMRSPYGLEGAKTKGSADVSHKSNHNHGRGLDEGHTLAHLLLMHL
mmetsp:Transcript_2405/g.3329  ORF Transcript_2405/g.3329 Transcript_2405/m.3329 type:complete len:210 (+) Transcript_2405:620-1249(+)